MWIEKNLRPTREIDFTTYRPQRAGVIPWTTVGDVKLFILGVDTRYQELTDFGGGVNRRDKTALDGALREFREETLAAFPTPTEDQLQGAVWATGPTMMIGFVPYPELDLRLLMRKFHQQLELERMPEVSELIWVTEFELTQLRTAGYEVKHGSKSYHLYERVRRLLAL